jgi:hypothetical protein
VKIVARYNTPLSAETRRDMELEEDEAYMTLHYELRSSYTRFSSVHLLVTSEDIYRGGQPRLHQDIVICSNAFGGKLPCGRRDGSGMLLLNRTLLARMDPEAGRRAQNGTAPTSGSEGDETIMVSESLEAQKLRALESALANNRRFYLVFFSESAASAQSRDNGNNDDDALSEYVALIVKPVPCN